MVQLPPEVFSAIVSYATPRDILVLSRTSKAFHRATEPRIYASVVLCDVQSIFLGCHSLLVRDAYRCPYVKALIIFQDPQRVTNRNNVTNTPLQFWLAIQHVLIKTVNLENLYLHVTSATHTWILDHDEIKLQLREANLRLPWDEHVVSFLETQPKLKILATDDSRDDGPLYPLSPTALPILECYSGPLLVVPELLGCPLRRLQMRTKNETARLVPSILSDLGKITKTLRNLCILGLPEKLTLETVQLVSTAVFAPYLHYLGILPLPGTPSEASWKHLYHCLMKLSALALLELDVAHLEPRPNENMQRVILHELRIFCPTLQQVVYWIGQHRFQWLCRDGQWQAIYSTNRHRLHDNLWRTVS
ncbi:hypothetical protein C2E23DRAFT_888202 [Lenzites betulinus]|nr:hypothetical protein C2E23DRAFT_888202 [Lenzites betulinus]